MGNKVFGVVCSRGNRVIDVARPAEFNREEVLGRATQVFWDYGYCATSISRLVEATKLKPGSLYAAFESKEGLFLAALDHYAAQTRVRLSAALDASENPIDGIEAFFTRLVHSQADTRPGRGCLLVNTVLEVGRHNETVIAKVKGHLDEIEAMLHEALTRAQARGYLAGDRSPEALAAFLMTTIWGLRVLGGTGASIERADRVVDQVMSLLR